MGIKIKERNRRYTGIETVVVGIRAEKSLFDRYDELAKEQGTSRNNLIVSVLQNYEKKIK